MCLKRSYCELKEREGNTLITVCLMQKYVIFVYLYQNINNEVRQQKNFIN